MDIYDQLLDAQGPATGGAIPQPAANEPINPSAPAAPDAYDSLLDQQEVMAAREIRGTYDVATRVNPDQYAASQKLAQRAGLPVDTVERNQAEVQRRLQVRDLEVAKLMQSSPVLARQLGDPAFAKISHDDVDNMGIAETLVNSFRRGLPALKSLPSALRVIDQSAGLQQFDYVDRVLADGGQPDPVRLGVIGQQYANADAKTRAWMRERYVPATEEAIVGAAGDLAALQQQRQAIPLPGVVGRAGSAETFSEALDAILEHPLQYIAAIGPESLVQSAPGMLASIPAGIAGGPLGVAGATGANSALVDYAASLVEGMNRAGIDTTDPDAIRSGLRNPEVLAGIVQAASLHAAVVGGFDALSGGLASRSLLPGALAERMASQPLAREMANIALQTPAQMALGAVGEAGGQLAAGQEIQPGDILAEAFGELFGTPAEVVSASGRRYLEQRAEAQRAAANAAVMDQMAQVVAADKVLQRSPETFEAFIAAASEDGPVQDIYLDAAVLMQSGVVEQVATLSQSAAQQMPNALATGGLIRIPLSEYAATILPSEIGPSLNDFIKTEPEGFSRAEAQAFMEAEGAQLQADIEAQLTEQEAIEATASSREAVQAEMRNQLEQTGRFTPEVNDAYASMVGSFYQTMGERIGVSAQDLYQRHPLKVTSTPIVGEGLDQQRAGPFGPVFSEFKGDPQGAIAKLMETQTGEAEAALNHPEIGDIDLVWGEAGTAASDGYGLAKLAKWHPEVLADLQGILSRMTVTKRTPNRINLESEDHRAAVRLTWDAQAKQWLLTAFEKRKGAADTSTGTVSADGQDVTARQASAPDDSVDRLLQDYYRKEARGAYDPLRNTISLLESADLSTFLHESGHAFLEILTDLAGQPDVPAQVQQDMQAVLEWFGVDSLQTWQGMTLEQRRESHEKFARGFEAYLFEGEAPSLEMRGVFQRFRSWLVRVYRTLAALNVKLTDEVRGVFDRMLASEQQIQTAEQARSMLPLFTAPEEAGWTPEEFQAYQELGADATATAVEELQARSLRDMQWMHNARGRAIKRLQSQAKAQRAEVRTKVADEVGQLPVYRAREFLRSGKLELPETANRAQRRAAEALSGLPNKLSLPALKEMYGEDPVAIWRYLPVGKTGLAAADGVHPDLVAPLFGFPGGDSMVRLLVEAGSPNEQIESLTDQRMLEQYGDLNSPEAIERAADEAVHNDMRARVVAAELNALSKATGRRKTLASAAKEFAARIVSRQRIRDIRPGQYTAAEARAARAADRAFKAGETAQAAVEKRNQLLNLYAAKAAHAANETVDKGVRYLNKFNREGTRRGLDPDYLEQIDTLLERFDLRRGQSLRAIDKRTALAQWIASQEEQGIEPDISDFLRNEAARTHYRNLTLEEFTGLVDAVRQIEHLGRLKNRLLTAKRNRELTAVVDEIKERIVQASSGRVVDNEVRETVGSKLSALGKGLFAAHRKAASVVRQMDGLADGGPFWEYFTRSMNEAGEREASMRADAAQHLHELAKPLLRGEPMGGKGIEFPSLGRKLNRGERIAIALNWGNEGNRQRLLDGRGWTPAQVNPVLATLTVEEWAFVQGAWDFFESYRPEIAAKERRVYGKEPNWVEPSSFTVTTPSGQAIEMRGGYYPIKYDPRQSGRVAADSDADEAKAMMRAAYTAATTRRTFTKNRAAEVSGRPLLLTFDGIWQGANEVIHDLAWHEWLVDANKLLRRLDDPIRTHYGAEFVDVLRKAVKDTARGDAPAANAVEKALQHIRNGSTIVGMGWNLTTALMQPLGLTNSIVRVGAEWVAKGMSQFYGRPSHMVQVAQEVQDLSEFMRNRSRTMNREINDIRNQMVGDKSDFRQWVEGSFFVMIQHAQAMVDYPTWLGAYEKAMADPANRKADGTIDEQRAVALADQAVIDSQGSGLTKDLAEVQRGGPLMKLFTNFYSYFSVLFNLTVERAAATSFRNPAQVANLAGDYLLLMVVPAVMSAIIRNAMKGEDDEDEYAKAIVSELVGYPFGMFVGLRDLAGAVQVAAGVGNPAFGYSGPAGLRFFSEMHKLGQQMNQGEFDMAAIKAANNVGGILFHYPAGQVNRTVEGAAALMEGETESPLSLVVGPPR